ncbi:hypothetical protein [Algoriphagus boseongensis]|nr:hypothetical protein [Algoriphagus boseongensis]
MGSSNTVIVVVVILAAHFLFGIGYLLYKVMGKSEKKEEEK